MKKLNLALLGAITISGIMLSGCYPRYRSTVVYRRPIPIYQPVYVEEHYVVEQSTGDSVAGGAVGGLIGGVVGGIIGSSIR